MVKLQYRPNHKLSLSLGGSEGRTHTPSEVSQNEKTKMAESLCFCLVQPWAWSLLEKSMSLLGTVALCSGGGLLWRMMANSPLSGARARSLPFNQSSANAIQCLWFDLLSDFIIIITSGSSTWVVVVGYVCLYPWMMCVSTSTTARMWGS